MWRMPPVAEIRYRADVKKIHVDETGFLDLGEGRHDQGRLAYPAFTRDNDILP